MRPARKSGIRPQDKKWPGPSERAQALTEALRERRRGIQEELERLLRRLREEERSETGDEWEQAVHGFDRELGSARVDQLIQVRRQIDDALARHAEGRYGRCGVCEGEIPVARLRSLPFAPYCRDCQALAEEKRAVLLGPIARTPGVGLDVRRLETGM